MGILSDIYVASPDEAKLYDTDQKRFAAVAAQSKGFTELELSTLWAILDNCEWDENLLDEFHNILTIADGERLITRLPDALLDRLTAANDQQLTAAAEQWAATDELQCDPADARQFMNDMIRLWRLARSINKSLHLWNSV
jgi:hypothetical protein